MKPKTHLSISTTKCYPVWACNQDRRAWSGETHRWDERKQVTCLKCKKYIKKREN